MQAFFRNGGILERLRWANAYQVPALGNIVQGLNEPDECAVPQRLSHPLVLACDDGYAMPLATALRSVVDANQSNWPLEVCVFFDDFSEDTQKKVLDSLPTGSASIRWIQANLGLFSDFTTKSHMPKMAFARLLVPRLLPNTVTRVLYLDADLLVLDDLTSLFETDLEGAVVGAVRDGLDPLIKAAQPGTEGFPRVRDYFNSGVLLIDLDRWRNEHISEKAAEYLTLNPQSPLGDQDALNVVCDGHWKELNPRWNFQDYYEEKKISKMPYEQRPGIAHFITTLKPWKSSSMSLNASFYDTFRSRTCFARTPQNRLSDVFFKVWYRLKRFLKRYTLVTAIWSRTRAAVFLSAGLKRLLFG